MNRNLLSALASGLLFGLGLALSGMTRPEKVVGFLDVTGAWDTSLAFVMGGAVLVYATVRRFALGRGAPVFAPSFGEPSRRDIDPRLVGGAALFGAGWGLAGYCPGPAIVSAVPAGGSATTFLVAMLAGMLLHHVSERVRTVAAARA